MSNDHKTTDSRSAERSGAKGGVTRRKWMLVTIGGLMAASGYGAFGQLKEPDPGVISIEGPFKEFGSISLADLDVPKGAEAFQPVRMKLEGSLRSVDRAFIVFTFKGDENPSRVLTVKAVARDVQGRVVASEIQTFRDPRIEAKKPQPLGFEMDPMANISLRLPKGELFSRIGSIDLYVTEGRESSSQRNGGGLTERDPGVISIEGPFKEFGSISLADLDVPKGAEAFQPVRMKLVGSLRSVDRAFIVFTFKGDEDPSRVLTVEAVARDVHGRTVASEIQTFRDPRIEAKKPQPLGFEMDPMANISLRLPKGVLLSGIESIELSVKEGRREPESR